MVFELAECGSCRLKFRYPREYGVVRYCSANCRVRSEPPANPWEYKGCVGSKYFSKRRRRAYRAGDYIDPLTVYVASNWTCHLCCGKIDPTLVSPDPMCATIDHIVPLGAGGRHTWDNIAASHKKCNEDKDTNEESLTSKRSANSVS